MSKPRYLSSLVTASLLLGALLGCESRPQVNRSNYLPQEEEGTGGQGGAESSGGTGGGVVIATGGNTSDNRPLKPAPPARTMASGGQKSSPLKARMARKRPTSRS